jgi:hypothetical protein
VLGYKPAWTARTKGWNHAVAMTSDGDVLALSAFDLTVFARHDGRAVDSLRICRRIALRANSLYVRGDRAFVVCQDAVHEVKLPGLAHRKVLDIPWGDDFDRHAEECAFGPDRLALLNDQGELLEFDTQGWKPLSKRSLPGGGDAESLGYGPKGRLLAVARRGHDVTLIEGGRTRALAGFGRGSGALALSPSGDELFGEKGSFTAARISLKDGFIRGDTKVSSWLTTARYVDGQLVAAAGAHGVALFPVAGGGKPALLAKDTGEGLGVSRDGNMLCAGNRSTALRCWWKRPLAASRYPAPKASSSGSKPPAGSSPAAGAGTTREGTIAWRRGKQLAIRVSDTSGVALGAKGQLELKVARKLGSIRFSAWLSIAEVTVTAVRGAELTLAIERETSVMRKNGVKVDHFTPGERVRLSPR